MLLVVIVAGRRGMPGDLDEVAYSGMARSPYALVVAGPFLQQFLLIFDFQPEPAPGGSPSGPVVRVFVGDEFQNACAKGIVSNLGHNVEFEWDVDRLLEIPRLLDAFPRSHRNTPCNQWVSTTAGAR